jgi:dihydrofolate reductase
MISSVVAVEQGCGIGFNGSMPWPRLKEDMQWFKELTTGHIVIMGSTTWKGFLKPLPNRINIVISRYHHMDADYCYTSPIDAIGECHSLHPEKKIFIIGGQELYDSTIHLIDNFYITEIASHYKCDKFFDLSYVQKNFVSRLISQHTDTESSVAFTIKEYSK